MSKYDKALVTAAQFLQRIEICGLTESEWKELGAWLNESEIHKKAYKEAKISWNFTSVRRDDIKQILALAPENDVNTWSAEKRVYSYIENLRLLWLKPLFASAAIAMLIGIIFIALFTDSNEIPYTFVETDFGKTNSIKMEDGSVIELNTSTTLGYHYSDKERNIYIENGEVYFDIEKDISRHFEIHAGNNSIVVIGTSFNLKYLDQILDIDVIEGMISVKPGSVSSPIRLGEKESLRIEPNGKIHRENTNSSLALAWRSGAIAFENQSLASILKDLDRYFPEQLSSDNVVDDRLYTGLIYMNDLDKVLMQLSAISSTEIIFDQDRGLEIN